MIYSMCYYYYLQLQENCIDNNYSDSTISIFTVVSYGLQYDGGMLVNIVRLSDTETIL